MRGERRQERDRLEIGDVLRRAAERLHVGPPYAEIIGEEHHVEFAALGGARDLEVMLEIDAGIGLRARVPPRRDVMAGRIEESAEPHLAIAAQLFALSLLSTAKPGTGLLRPIASARRSATVCR